MKSRTSCFNPAAFKKNITRFAPVWVLYTVFLMMVLTVVLIDDSEYYRTTNLAGTLSFMAFVNLCYGLLNGQLLFGDLFNARHCNALHAMPLRRECWFVTHTVSGLLFALVPNLVMILIALPMLGAGWSAALWWWLAAALQYLFFFGLAVCSALCVGNRFAMILVYGIVNFFSLIVYWFYDTIYQPLLYGVYVTEEHFLQWSPVCGMILNCGELVEVNRRTLESAIAIRYNVESVAPGVSWWYLIECAALGLALLGVALVLYRRRKLESAGDFMAVRVLEPVFLVLYTLSVAAFFQIFARLFGVLDVTFLAIGLVVGFFTGRMLLMRTTRVFQPGAFGYFAILAVVFVATLILTLLDPMGVTRYVPDDEDVQEVYLANAYNVYDPTTPALDSQADIETVRQIHQMILDGQFVSPENDTDLNLNLYYVLKDGSTVKRQYQVGSDSPVGEAVEKFFTRPEYVLGTADVTALLPNVVELRYTNYTTGVGGAIPRQSPEARGLLEAILADCAEGNMAQSWCYHDDEEDVAWVEFSLEDGYGGYEYTTIRIYEFCCHTIAFLEENELPVEEEFIG